MFKQVIASVITSIVTAIAIGVWALLTSIPGKLLLPKGAVVAFKGTCPTVGWNPYERASGRMIMGVGRIPGSEIDLTSELWGGSHQTVLTERNLAPHKHDTRLAVQGTKTPWGTGLVKENVVFGKEYGSFETGLTDLTGQAEPFSRLSPYVALHYCEKIS